MGKCPLLLLFPLLAYKMYVHCSLQFSLQTIRMEKRLLTSFKNRLFFFLFIFLRNPKKRNFQTTIKSGDCEKSTFEEFIFFHVMLFFSGGEREKKTRKRQKRSSYFQILRAQISLSFPVLLRFEWTFGANFLLLLTFKMAHCQTQSIIHKTEENRLFPPQQH